MEYTTLGDTGTSISQICLGCMSFGSSERKDWVLGPEEGKELIETAIDLGINFFDTANIYSYGKSEQILGDTLKEYDRNEQVVATKVFFPMRESNPNSGGLSRKAIEQELSNSLNRLGLETVDLYQIHRWDYKTPIAETMGALTDAVRRNQVRYLGASSMWAHQFADALHTSDEFGFERFVSMQNHYNLAYREEEREMVPLCEQENIGILPWSPLARGFLARPLEAFTLTNRGEYMNNNRHLSERISTYRANGGDEINSRVEELADERGVTMAQIALAWLLHQDSVAAPVVGTTSVEHLEEAAEAVKISLSKSDQEYLTEPYGPVQINGHS